MFPGNKSEWHGGFDKYEFESGGKPVTIICPETPRAGSPWAWKGEFLNAFPGTEIALLKEGFHIAYLRDSDTFGCQDTVARWTAFYTTLTGDFGFSKKVALIGLSRGAMYCYQWAIANPEKVACIYGDAPVCDMRSWPGGKGKGEGSPADWQKAMNAYGFSSEDEAMRSTVNPVDNLQVLADHKIPILHVYGDADVTVPWDENTEVVAERYRALGGHIELIDKPGCGHHPHGLDDPSPVVEFIIKALSSSVSRG